MIQNFLKYIQGSFDTKPGNGASARKLSAFWIIMLITGLHFTYFRDQYKHEGDFGLLIEILFLDLCFVCVALGMTTVETILKLKNGNTEKKEEKTDGGEGNV